MINVKLGHSGLTVSKICFGSLTVGPLQASLSIDEGSGIIAYAINRGINFIDTAELYNTYEYIREGIKKSGYKETVISSKTYAYTKDMARKAVEDARTRLDRDYIDIFMLHEQESIYTLEGHKEALDFLFECKAKGIIRAVGASMHHIAAVYGAIEAKLDVIHPIINTAGLGIVGGSREEMLEALKKAKAKGIGIFSMKAFGGGNLFLKAEECLSFVFGEPSIDAVAIGMQSISEVDANIGFAETGSFSSQSKRTIGFKQRYLHIEDYCTGCGCCVKRCPNNALNIKDKTAVCDKKKCLLCGYCSAICPMFAIRVL